MKSFPRYVDRKQMQQVEFGIPNVASMCCQPGVKQKRNAEFGSPPAKDYFIREQCCVISSHQVGLEETRHAEFRVPTVASICCQPGLNQTRHVELGSPFAKDYLIREQCCVISAHQVGLE